MRLHGFTGSNRCWRGGRSSSPVSRHTASHLLLDNIHELKESITHLLFRQFVQLEDFIPQNALLVAAIVVLPVSTFPNRLIALFFRSALHTPLFSQNKFVLHYQQSCLTHQRKAVGTCIITFKIQRRRVSDYAAGWRKLPNLWGDGLPWHSSHQPNEFLCLPRPPYGTIRQASPLIDLFTDFQSATVAPPLH